VPLADAAADHQSANAIRYAASGAALWARESDWQRSRIAADVVAIVEASERWRTMANAARAVARPDAAAAVVADCERVMAGRW
jgi:UDP-N-acetylglucosamine--N-acetylmuramyl-(pentapeptide) pyrophosphoryl-undecaprenol N-acetylglucosamine transferase